MPSSQGRACFSADHLLRLAAAGGSVSSGGCLPFSLGPESRSWSLRPIDPKQDLERELWGQGLRTAGAAPAEGQGRRYGSVPAAPREGPWVTEVMKRYISSLLGAFTVRTSGHWHPPSPESRLEKCWASLMVLPITSNTVTPDMASATFNTTATVCPAIHPHEHHSLHTPLCAATCSIRSLLPTTFKATPTPTHIFCTMTSSPSTVPVASANVMLSLHQRPWHSLAAASPCTCAGRLPHLGSSIWQWQW